MPPTLTQVYSVRLRTKYLTTKNNPHFLAQVCSDRIAGRVLVPIQFDKAQVRHPHKPCAAYLRQNREDEILIEKPRIYINGENGKYAVPDFAVVNTDTGNITKIVDAKNGTADLTNSQKLLNKNGGRFKGSSRAPNAPAQDIAPGSIKVERTNIKATGS